MSQQTDMLRAVALGNPSASGNGIVQRQTFDVDAWHAMQERDDQLIRDSILHGYTGKEYVYQFSIGGTDVTGVSVVGARELASQYGGIKSRIVASVDKSGSLFVFKSFEPMAIQAQIIPQLTDQEDFYEVVMEITDIKTGNSIQVRKKETKTERKRNGDRYDRPHYDVIAESKAYRNGILSILPQSVINEFERRALNAGNAGKEKTMDQLREGVIAFAAKHAIGVDRQSLDGLTYAQIMGLGNAANVGIEAFKLSLGALKLTTAQIEDASFNEPKDKKPAKTAQQEAKPAAAAAQTTSASSSSAPASQGSTKEAPAPSGKTPDSPFSKVCAMIEKASKTRDEETKTLLLDEARSSIAELTDPEQKAAATELLAKSRTQE